MKNFFLFLALLFFSLVHGEDFDPVILASTSNMPESNVDSVNVITGDLGFAYQGIVINGAQPIHIQNLYLSRLANSFQRGWLPMVNHPFAIYRPKIGQFLVPEKSGAFLSYMQKSSHKQKVLFFSVNPICFQSGYAHVPENGFHPKNNHLELREKRSLLYVYRADGSSSIYERVTEDAGPDTPALEAVYRLQEDILPNGNHFVYTWHKNMLEKITSTSPGKQIQYAWAKFHYHYEEPKKQNRKHLKTMTIETSDGRALILHFRKVGRLKHRNYLPLLECVESPEAPMESFAYDRLKDRKQRPIFPILCKHIMPDERIREFHYLEKDREFQVQKIKAPIGEDNTLHNAYRFDYHEGHTDVFDAENNLTRYFFKDLRLTKIQRYEGRDKLKNSEQFLWETSQDSSLLLCRIFFDENNVPIFSRRFFYDERGNLIKEILYGNLSGKSGPLVLNHKGFPEENGVESYTIKRSYNERNLLTKEETPEGLTTYYKYFPYYNSIKAKFLCNKNTVLKRHIYEYTHCNILAKEIVDDGSSFDETDLTGVTERHITIIHPKKDQPYQNLPEIIEEKALDLDSGEEKLLKKTVNFYNLEGKVWKQDIYDNTSSDRYSLYFHYDSKGRLRKKTNPIGQVAVYDYDSNFNQTYLRDFGAQTEIFNSYDFANRLTAEKEVGKDGNIHLALHQYDKKNNTTFTIDTFGNVTGFSYNLFGAVKEITYPKVLDEEECLAVPKQHFVYNGLNCKIQETDPKGNHTIYQYNAYRSPIKILYSDGTAESYTYYPNGKVKTYTDQQKVVTKYTYDVFQREIKKEVFSPSGELLKTEEKNYSAFHLLSETDPEGYATYYSYDFAGRKIKKKREGEIQTYAYDSLGRLHKVYEHNGCNTLITVFERDLLDRILEQRQEDLNGNILSLLRYSYDESGNLQRKISYHQEKESLEQYFYDPFCRLTAVINPLGDKTLYEYNEQHVNSLGQRALQKITIDPLQRHTFETFDALNRKVSIEKKNASGQTISLENLYYDPNGNLSRQVSSIISPLHPAKKCYTLWNYDAMNRLESLTEAAFSPEEQTTHYTYTSRGELAQTIKPDGISLDYSYDDLGRNIFLASSDGTIAYRYSYNLLDQMIQSEDLIHHQTIERILDSKGRILQETFPGGFSLHSSYDMLGRKTNIELPDQSSIHYTYDPLYLREASRKDSDGFALYAHFFEEYDLSGNLLRERFGKDYEVQYAYDPLGRRISHKSPSFFAAIHQFDPVGNIISQTIRGHTFHYEYDDLDQLIAEKGPFSHKYVFDSHYSRLQKDADPIQVNQLHQDKTHYTYDQRGNPLSKHTRQGDIHFAYDALDRLAQMILSDGQIIQYTYDGLHRRLSKTIYPSDNTPPSQSFYLYDEQKEIGCINELGIQQLRILGDTKSAEIGSSIAMEIQGKTYFPLHDLQGNVASLISSADFRPVETYLFSAFGEEMVFDSQNRIQKIPAINPWRFSSKRVEESGLVFFGRRYYDPNTGRWLTADPQGFTDSLNLYAFVTNNPLIHIDLYGLFSSDLKHSSLTIQEREKNLINNPYFDEKLFKERPKNFSLQDHTGFPLKTQDGFGLGFTNGIKNNFSTCLKNTQYLSRLSGGYDITATHIPTGGLLKDLARCDFHLNLVSTQSVQKIKSKWMNFFEKNPDGKWLEICHSGGAGAVHLALLSMDKELRSNINVLAIAPSIFIERGLSHGAVNYVSKNSDFVPNLHKKYGKMREIEKNSNVIYLDRHPKASRWDHSFQSPTYKREIRDYIKTFLGTKIYD
ncbi:MAG: hypothetical protein Tsb0015_05540 [Simkaniaceae bacterium]